MACTTCIRWMVWNESDQNQIFYYYSCNDGTTLLSTLVGPGQFYSVCGCQANGAYASSNDVYFENGGSGYINYNGILLQPCVDTPEPSITPTQFPTRTPNHTPSNTTTPTVTPTVTRTPNPTPTTTSIICGSGITTSSNYYYTDCCGAFINNKGEPLGQIVVFNYTQPYNGITKLYSPATVVCPTPFPTSSPTYTPTATQTPTYTPTNTSTPAVTPSPTPTVSVSKVYSLKNDCDVLTLFDMGVQCNPIQMPSSLYSNDGILSLNVTGGTSPYSYYWSNGQRTKTLAGVPQGSYTVTVVDYYGDYSSTTVCNLFAPSQTPTQTITPTPTITPSPVWGGLCFTYVNGATSYGPIQFTPFGNANGKPNWTGTYQGNLLLIQWSSASARWAISGLPFTTGIPVSYNQTNIPTGNWNLLGSGSKPNITTVIGTCPPVIPLTMSISKTNSTCPGNKNCDGSISLYAYNGVPPYSYSINNGLTYQSSGIFNGLCANNYTVVVQDSNGTIVNGGVVTIQANNPVTNYTISTQLLNVVSYSLQNQVASWKVNVTPALPVGVSISFQLKVNATKKVNSPGSGTTVNTTTVRKNGVTVTQPAVTSSSGTLIRTNCSPNTTTTTSTTQVYNLTIGYGDTITGTSSSVLTITSGATAPNGCITKLDQDILVSTYSPTLSGIGSCGDVYSNPTGQGVVGHTISSAVSVNPISLRTLTGTTSCSGGQTGVFGTTSLQTLYAQASPGFVDGANVYTNSSLNSTYAVPDGIVFRNPNSTSSSVFVTSGGQMVLVGPYGSTC